MAKLNLVMGLIVGSIAAYFIYTLYAYANNVLTTVLNMPIGK